jgi:hypothetical protein
MTDQPDVDIQFYQLILSLQAQAWQSLGKVASPITGKVERSLEQAKFAIDMIEMFQRKTKGNLNDEETRMIEHALYELRLNYVDELKKEKTNVEESQADKKDDDAPDTESSSGS